MKVIANSSLCNDLYNLFPNWISKSKSYLKPGAGEDSVQEPEETPPPPPPLLEFMSEVPNKEITAVLELLQEI